MPAILVGHSASTRPPAPSKHHDRRGGPSAFRAGRPTWHIRARPHPQAQSLNGDFQPPVLYPATSSGLIARSTSRRTRGGRDRRRPTTWQFVAGCARRGPSSPSRPMYGMPPTPPPVVAAIRVVTLRQAQGDSFDRLRAGSFDKLRAGSFDRLRGRPLGVGCAGDHQTAARTEALLIEREITRALEGAYFVTAPKDVERSSASAWKLRSP